MSLEAPHLRIGPTIANSGEMNQTQRKSLCIPIKYSTDAVLDVSMVNSISIARIELNSATLGAQPEIAPAIACRAGFFLN
jgi:hypothetical protein